MRYSCSFQTISALSRYFWITNYPNYMKFGYHVNQSAEWSPTQAVVHNAIFRDLFSAVCTFYHFTFTFKLVLIPFRLCLLRIRILLSFGRPSIPIPPSRLGVAPAYIRTGAVNAASLLAYRITAEEYCCSDDTGAIMRDRI